MTLNIFMSLNKIIARLSFVRFLALMGITLLFATACTNDVFHNESVHLKNSQWKAADTLFYTFNSKDTLATYDFYFEIRNTTDYDMQNLYMFITAYYPGNTYSVDTAECILAAPMANGTAKEWANTRITGFCSVKESGSANLEITLLQ